MSLKERKEKKSDNRRSSILKRQDTIRIENTEGDGPRTPRRVSFASTYTIKHFNPLPWHNSVSDESSSSGGTIHETFTSDGENDDIFQRQHSTTSSNLVHDVIQQPDECIQRHSPAVDASLHVVKEATDSESVGNKTILFTDMDEAGCLMETTANISQLSTSSHEPVFVEDFRLSQHTTIAERKRPITLDNLFSLISTSKFLDVHNIDSSVPSICLPPSYHRTVLNDISNLDEPPEDLLPEKKNSCSADSGRIVEENKCETVHFGSYEELGDMELTTTLTKTIHVGSGLSIANEKDISNSTGHFNRSNFSTEAAASQVTIYFGTKQLTSDSGQISKSDDMELTSVWEKTVDVGQKKVTHYSKAPIDESAESSFHERLQFVSQKENLYSIELDDKSKSVDKRTRGHSAGQWQSDAVTTSQVTIHFGPQHQINDGNQIVESDDMELTTVWDKTIEVGQTKVPHGIQASNSEHVETSSRDIVLLKTLQCEAQKENMPMVVESGAMKAAVNNNNSHLNVSTVHTNITTSQRTIYSGPKQQGMNNDQLSESEDMELTTVWEKSDYVGLNKSSHSMEVSYNDHSEKCLRERLPFKTITLEEQTEKEFKSYTKNDMNSSSNIPHLSTVNADAAASQVTIYFGSQLTSDSGQISKSDDMELTTVWEKTVDVGQKKVTNGSKEPNNESVDTLFHERLQFESQKENLCNIEVDDKSKSADKRTRGHSAGQWQPDAVTTSQVTIHFGPQHQINDRNQIVESDDMELTTVWDKTIEVGQTKVPHGIQASNSEHVETSLHERVQKEAQKENVYNIEFGDKNVVGHACVHFNRSTANAETTTSQVTMHFGHKQEKSDSGHIVETDDTELTTVWDKTIDVGQTKVTHGIQASNSEHVETSVHERVEIEAQKENLHTTEHRNDIYCLSDQFNLSVTKAKTLSDLTYSSPHKSETEKMRLATCESVHNQPQCIEAINEIHILKKTEDKESMKCLGGLISMNNNVQSMESIPSVSDSVVSCKDRQLKLLPIDQDNVCDKELTVFCKESNELLSTDNSIQLCDNSIPRVSRQLLVNLKEPSVSSLNEGKLIHKLTPNSSHETNDCEISFPKLTTEIVTSHCNSTSQTESREIEDLRTSVLNDLRGQLAQTQGFSLGKRKSTNFDLILGQRNKLSRALRLPSNNVILNRPVSSYSLSLSTVSCDGNNSRNTEPQFSSPLRSNQNVSTVSQGLLLSPDPSTHDSKDGLSPLPEYFCPTPTLALSAVHKYKVSGSLDELEMLDDQKMPDLSNSSFDGSFSAPVSTNRLQRPEIHLKDTTSLSDFLTPLGINLKKNEQIKKLPQQHVSTLTIQDKLKALVSFVPKIVILKQYLSSLESARKKVQQDCQSKLLQYSEQLPSVYSLISQNDQTTVSCLTKMIENSKLLAYSKMNKHKVDYLQKYNAARESVHEALQAETNDVLTEIEQVVSMTHEIDERLKEMNLKSKEKKDGSQLKEIERAKDQLKLQCKESLQKIETIQTENEASERRITELFTSVNVLKERLFWTERLTEWTILETAENEVDFGFLWKTLILNVKFSRHSKRILTVSLKNNLSDSSQPWAKCAVTYAMSSIDCQLLQETYPNIHKMNQLLDEVSTKVFASRQLSMELKDLNFNHDLTINNDSLTIVVSDRATCRKISLETTLAPNTYPNRKLPWTIVPLIGCPQLDVVQETIDDVFAGDGYLTRIISVVKQVCLYDHTATG